MTEYCYDTEFLEDGRTIELISIGIVADDGREYYAVSDDTTNGELNRRIRRHQWLMANVVPGLPKPYGDWNNHMPRNWLFDYSSPYVRGRGYIAAEVRDFLLAGVGEVRLWADYGAYDHVALCQLWGPMMDLPDGLPMFTCDIQQEAARLGITDDQMPAQKTGLHNALEDARHTRTKLRFIREKVSA